MRRIGRFTITDKLGSGSNGNVMLGHDPVIDRPVAIKILNNHGGASDKKQREQQFINEARAAVASRIPTSSPFTMRRPKGTQPSSRWNSCKAKTYGN